MAAYLCRVFGVDRKLKMATTTAMRLAYIEIHFQKSFKTFELNHTHMILGWI
jgi:hypothetical protein